MNKQHSPTETSCSFGSDEQQSALQTSHPLTTDGHEKEKQLPQKNSGTRKKQKQRDVKVKKKELSAGELFLIELKAKGYKEDRVGQGFVMHIPHPSR
jgi:hypothetical protein